MKKYTLSVLILSFIMLCGITVFSDGMSERTLEGYKTEFYSSDKEEKIVISENGGNNSFCVGAGEADNAAQERCAYKLSFGAKAGKGAAGKVLKVFLSYINAENNSDECLLIDEFNLSDVYYINAEKIFKTDVSSVSSAKITYKLENAAEGDEYFIKDFDFTRQGLWNASCKTSGEGTLVTVLNKGGNYEMNNEYAISVPEYNETDQKRNIYQLQYGAKAKPGAAVCCAAVFFDCTEEKTVVKKMGELVCSGFDNDVYSGFFSFDVQGMISDFRIEFYLKNGKEGESYILTDYKLRKMSFWNGNAAVSGGDLSYVVSNVDNDYIMNNQCGVRLDNISGNQSGKSYNLNISLKGNETGGELNVGAALSYWSWSRGKTIIENIGQITLRSAETVNFKKQISIDESEGLSDVQLLVYPEHGKAGQGFIIEGFTFDEVFKPIISIPDENVGQLNNFAIIFDEELSEESCIKPGNVLINNSLKNIDSVFLLNKKTVVIKLKKPLEAFRKNVVKIDGIKSLSGKKSENLIIPFETLKKEEISGGLIISGLETEKSENNAVMYAKRIANVSDENKELNIIAAEYEGGMLKNAEGKKIILAPGYGAENISISKIIENEAGVFIFEGLNPLTDKKIFFK